MENIIGWVNPYSLEQQNRTYGKANNLRGRYMPLSKDNKTNRRPHGSVWNLRKGREKNIIRKESVEENVRKISLCSILDFVILSPISPRTK